MIGIELIYRFEEYVKATGFGFIKKIPVDTFYFVGYDLMVYLSVSYNLISLVIRSLANATFPLWIIITKPEHLPLFGRIPMVVMMLSWFFSSVVLK